MKKQKITLLTLLSFIFLFSSCSKDDETVPSNILTSKTWKRGMVDKNPSSSPSGSVLYYPVQECEKDDTFRFGSDSKLTVNQGASKCDKNEPASKTVTYSYDEKANTLTIDGINYSVAEMSKSQIKYYIPFASSTGYANYIFLLE